MAPGATSRPEGVPTRYSLESRGDEWLHGPVSPFSLNQPDQGFEAYEELKVVDAPRQTTGELPGGAGREHSDEPVQFVANIRSLRSRERGRRRIRNLLRGTPLADERDSLPDHDPRQRIDSAVDRPSVNGRYSGNGRDLASRRSVPSQTSLAKGTNPTTQCFERVPSGPPHRGVQSLSRGPHDSPTMGRAVRNPEPVVSSGRVGRHRSLLARPKFLSR
jgi:hypothetical protein